MRTPANFSIPENFRQSAVEARQMPWEASPAKDDGQRTANAKIVGNEVAMGLEEPPGWRELQEKARRAKDARELSEVIDEMNRLLSEWEKRAEDGPHGRGRGRESRKPTNRGLS